MQDEFSAPLLYYTPVLHKGSPFAIVKLKQPEFTTYWNSRLGLLALDSQPSGEIQEAVELAPETYGVSPFAVLQKEDGFFRVVRRDWQDGSISVSVLLDDVTRESAEKAMANYICERLSAKGFEIFVQDGAINGQERYFKYSVGKGREAVEKLPYHLTLSDDVTKETDRVRPDALKTFLRDYRKARKWSQIDMAAASGESVSRASWSAFEVGAQKSNRLAVSLMEKVMTKPSERFRLLSSYLQTNHDIPVPLPEDLLAEIADMFFRRAEILALEEAGAEVLWTFEM